MDGRELGAEEREDIRRLAQKAESDEDQKLFTQKAERIAGHSQKAEDTNDGKTRRKRNFKGDRRKRDSRPQKAGLTGVRSSRRKRIDVEPKIVAEEA